MIAVLTVEDICAYTCHLFDLMLIRIFLVPYMLSV